MSPRDSIEIVAAALRWSTVYERRRAAGAEKRLADGAYRADWTRPGVASRAGEASRRVTELKRQERAAMRALAKACAKARSDLLEADVVEVAVALVAAVGPARSAGDAPAAFTQTASEPNATALDPHPFRQAPSPPGLQFLNQLTQSTMTTIPLNQRSTVPDGDATLAARQKLADLRTTITTLEGEQEALNDEVQAANQRANEATSKRNTAEALHCRSVLGEEVPAPTPAKLADLMAKQVIAERDAVGVRGRVQAEIARVSAALEKARAKVLDAERAIDQSRFHELTAAYLTHIRDAIPLATALRAAAAQVGRRVEGEPLLINPDEEYGRQLFGVPLH